MPRVPESAVTRGLPGVSAQPIREKAQIGRAVSDSLGRFAELSSQLAEAERAEELTRKSSIVEGSLAELQLRIAQDPEIDTMDAAGQAYEAGANEIFNEYGQSESPTVSRALEKQFLSSMLQGRVAVMKSGYKRQADNAVANLDATAETLERAYALAPDDERRAEIRSIHARGVHLSKFISEENKGDRVRDFQMRTDKARVRGLIDVGDFEGAEELLDGRLLRTAACPEGRESRTHHPLFVLHQRTSFRRA